MAKKDELNFENENNMASSEKLKALQAAMDKIEKSFGKGSIMKMGDESVEQVVVIPRLYRTERSTGRWRLSPRTYHRDLWPGIFR